MAWNSKTRCPATVVQSGEHFDPRGTHNHPPQDNLSTKTALTAAVKKKALEQVRIFYMAVLFDSLL